MSAFSIRKQSPNQSDKSPSVAIKSRQQATHDINKRRTLLQDNSWIKKRPEEESADENYGRAVLNQYKSQDGLHSSSTNEKEDQKTVLGRYRSDTTLDRIPDRNDTDKINKSPTLNNKQSNRQSLTPSASPTNTAATSPIKKKRQSWIPPPVSSSKTTTETVETKWTTSENSEAPATADFSSEQVSPQKPKTDVDNQATARNQDLNKPIKVNPSSFTSDKEGKELEDFTEINTAGQKNKRITEQAYENPPRAPSNLPETNYSRDSRRKTSKSSYGAYEENITGNTIKTVYSTSDRFLPQTAVYSPKFPSFVRMVSAMTNFMYSCGVRGSHDDAVKNSVFSHQLRSIIGKDICTYCRKPLGIDAKMILDALQICCHSTCFKCEVCKRSLEDLKAGDSIWIYRKTVHCEPCYSKIKENWIY